MRDIPKSIAGSATFDEDALTVEDRLKIDEKFDSKSNNYTAIKKLIGRPAGWSNEKLRKYQCDRRKSEDNLRPAVIATREWEPSSFIGCEVQKLFGDHLYPGQVKKHDAVTGWFRVEYDDGDAEDLAIRAMRKILKYPIAHG